MRHEWNDSSSCSLTQGGGHRAAATALGNGGSGGGKAVGSPTDEPSGTTGRNRYPQEIRQHTHPRSSTIRCYGRAGRSGARSSCGYYNWPFGSTTAQPSNCLRSTGRETRPDLVVSFVPHFNRAMGESLRHVFPERPFVTILTDLADYPPHFWIERQPQYLICGSHRAIARARSMGHARKTEFSRPRG